MISEADIIHRIKNSFPKYIGHDTAEIDVPTDSCCVVTKDLLIDNIHFCTNYVEPKSLAYKALHANLSDLAASGTQPKFIILGLSIPKSKETYVYEFIDHFLRLCKSEKVDIIGGDTTASQSSLFISITAIGYTQKGHRKIRCGAKKNDLICITGPIGKSHLGFLALENKVNGLLEFKKSFLFPKAKVQEGIWLGKHSTVTSMMDISDGLFIDLKRLAETSKVRAEINLNKLPLSEPFIKACEFLKLNPFNILLIGGEDYGLLFTIQKEYFTKVSHQFFNTFGYQIHCIGKVEDGDGINIKKCGNKINLPLKPFSHFGEDLDLQSLK